MQDKQTTKRPLISSDLHAAVQQFANLATDGNFTRAVDELIRLGLPDRDLVERELRAAETLDKVFGAVTRSPRKESEFDKTFSEPNHFSDGTLVISAGISRADAAKAISVYFGEHITEDKLVIDRVRYGFAPEYVEDTQGEACWYTGATGKGSMLVWVYKEIK